MTMEMIEPSGHEERLDRDDTRDPLFITGPLIRSYDSPKVREFEAWRATQRDAGAVATAIDLILTPTWAVDSGETLMHIMFALWDSSMVRLFRHYTNSPIPEIRRLYDDLADNLGLANELVQWKKDRDKRVAHPVGHNEFYLIAVELSESEDEVMEVRFPAGQLFNVQEGIEPVGRFAKALREAIRPIHSRLKREVEAEVRSLSARQLSELRPYTLHAHGRRYGA